MNDEKPEDFVGWICLFLCPSFIVSLAAYGVYCMGIYDDMHTISTDGTLNPNLTLSQVATDIWLTFNSWALICAGLVILITGFSLLIMRLGKTRNSKAVIKAVTRTAFACWLVLCSGPLMASVQYFVYVRQNLH